jgi:hypothetical protein
LVFHSRCYERQDVPAHGLASGESDTVEPCKSNLLSHGPRVDQRDPELGVVPGVAGCQRRAPGCGDPGDLRIADLDRAATLTPRAAIDAASRAAVCSNGRMRPSKSSSKCAGEFVLELPASAALRE